MIRILSGLLILFSLTYSSTLKAYTDSFADLVENLSPCSSKYCFYNNCYKQ